MAEGFILEIPEQVGQPVAARRKPQAKVREDIARKLRKELTALCEGLYPSAK